MRRVLLILTLLSITVRGISQARQSIRVKAGEDLAQAFSSSGFYRFPQFEKALVSYTNGTQEPRFRFNYNIYTANLQFISPAGDTLDVANPEAIDSVIFPRAVFYNRKGFHEVVARADSIRLLRKVTMTLQTEKIGGYGQPSPTSSIDNLKNFSIGNNFYSLTINQDVVINKNTSWFWMDINKNIVRANKANLLKILSPAKQAAVESYLKQQKVNFEKEEELKKLLSTIEAS